MTSVRTYVLGTFALAGIAFSNRTFAQTRHKVSSHVTEETTNAHSGLKNGKVLLVKDDHSNSFMFDTTGRLMTATFVDLKAYSAVALSHAEIFVADQTFTSDNKGDTLIARSINYLTNLKPFKGFSFQDIDSMTVAVKRAISRAADTLQQATHIRHVEQFDGNTSYSFAAQYDPLITNDVQTQSGSPPKRKQAKNSSSKHSSSTLKSAHSTQALARPIL